jgi:hypothetical protein
MLDFRKLKKAPANPAKGLLKTWLRVILWNRKEHVSFPRRRESMPFSNFMDDRFHGHNMTATQG